MSFFSFWYCCFKWRFRSKTQRYFSLLSKFILNCEFKIFYYKVWSAENGSNPVTLTGHTSGISDLSMVDKGRNVISVGRDGNCNLWDIGEAKCLTTFCKIDSFINCCSIESIENEISLLPTVSDDTYSNFKWI